MYLWTFKLVVVFLLWTFVVYFLHRLSHIKRKYNFLYHLHKVHHQINYQNGGSEFKIKFLFLNFGDIRLTLDIIVMLTIPLLCLTYFFPQQGVALLVYHYCAEVFFSERMVDHNPNFKGVSTKFFAWGEYHLKHHKNPKVNYSFIITLWDKVFRTEV